MQTLLEGKKIDLEHNRFLILQGEVEQIALMKPKELLEYLEDIIGTNKYVGQIDQKFQNNRFFFFQKSHMQRWFI